MTGRLALHKRLAAWPDTVVMMKRRSAKYLLPLLLSAATALWQGCKLVPLALDRQPTPTRTATAIPNPDWQEVSTYRTAMVPGAGDEVDGVTAPAFYHIRARVHLEGPQPWLTVVQDTHYTNRADVALDSVYFRVFPNKPSFGSAVTFSTVTAHGVEAQLDYSVERTALEVTLPQPLAQGQATDVHMEYDVTVPLANARGYGTFNYQDDILLLSNFFPLVAVLDSTGWNLSLAPDYGDPVYSETSFFTVELTVPDDVVVVSSGSTVSRQSNRDDTATWLCVSGPMRDFMVVMSPRFHSSSYALGYVRVNSYYVPEHQTSGEQVLVYARDSLRAYQQSFGPYPFVEFDVVEAPIAAGGMEYPGLIMLAGAQYATPGDYLEFVTAHEVAHQWWYSLVGNDQVNVPWLDESLTNFSTVYYYEHVYGREVAETAFANHIESRYLRAKRAGHDQVVAQPVQAFSPEDYGDIVYGKGAVFFDKLREQLGDALFLEVLRVYLEDRKYKLATGDDFVRVAEEVGGQDIGDLFGEWILEAQ